MTPGYTLGIRAYGLAVRIAASFKPKARLWVQGRKQWRQRLRKAVQGRDNWIWVHCSSLGEFEQGRPLIESIKDRNPEQALLLTFFSPSGYEIRKNYPLADAVCYLPLDTPRNAQDFIEIVQPSQAFFVKYDLWLNTLEQLSRKEIPHFLVSALLREDSRFLRTMIKGAYRKTFQNFDWIFAQDEATRDLLKEEVGTDRVSVTGDTRFDRAAQLPGQFRDVEGIREFVGDQPVVVVGSSYPKDEEIFMPAVEALRDKGLRWIVAPHNIDHDRIAGQVERSKGRMARYSRLEEAGEETELLWIDNVGMLSRLYHYSQVVYVGGGFGNTVHNTQEPAVYGNPVFFGPRYQGFREAVDMVAMGTAFSVNNSEEFLAGLTDLLENNTRLEQLREQNRAYMQSQAGATSAILQKLDELHGG